MLLLHPQQALAPQSSVVTASAYNSSTHLAASAMPRIFVDGDACPDVCMDILTRAAMRRQIHLLRVANRFLRLPASPYLSNIMVSNKAQAADIYIKKRLLPEDILIASDFNLIGVSVRKCAFVINQKGYVYTFENTAFSKSWKVSNQSDLYTSGWIGDKPYTKKDRIQFANALDRSLTCVLNRRMRTVARF